MVFKASCEALRGSLTTMSSAPWIGWYVSNFRNEDVGGRTTGAALGSKEFDDDGNGCGVLIIGGAGMGAGQDRRE